MMKLEVLRLERSKRGTFGVLRLDGEVMCMTLEPPDLGNRPFVSCIPDGSYVCVRRVSPRFGETFLIDDVPRRTDILFHTGNLVNDTRGCVLLGNKLGNVAGERAVLESRQAHRKFMEALDGERAAILDIVSA